MKFKKSSSKKKVADLGRKCYLSYPSEFNGMNFGKEDNTQLGKTVELKTAKELHTRINPPTKYYSAETSYKEN